MDIDESSSMQDLRHTREEMPEEIHSLVGLQGTPLFLEALSKAALQPQLTLLLFLRFECVYADTCARWMTAHADENDIIAAFARILPFAPYLGIFLERYLALKSKRDQKARCSLFKDNLDKNLTLLGLQRSLLAMWRLLNLDKKTFAGKINFSNVQSLFRHDNLAVRYLAIRVACQLLSASDLKMERMIDEYVNRKEIIQGDFDGREKDLIFLSLLEDNRLQEAESKRLKFKSFQDLGSGVINLENITPLVVQLGSILLPRPNGPPSIPSSIVTTLTASNNMKKFASCLLSSSPVLLSGLAGSGKTSLVNDFARELGFESSMVTLHLNEQTDAKMLIGMYTTGSKPGSFVWKAGVLTTAVKEGRWVYIEDLDHAPNEVISVILPLIEKRELLIPSRGEVIKADDGFRLLASIRTNRGITGQEKPLSLQMLGARLWQHVLVEMSPLDEFRQIIDVKYPILHEFLPGIIRTYHRLQNFSQKPSNKLKHVSVPGRAVSPRDLMKWCRRLEGALISNGSKTGREPISDSIRYEMFLEAIDCFAISLPTYDLRKNVILSIAEEMYIEPRQAEYFISSHVPKYEEHENRLAIGRARLARRTQIKKYNGSSRPFANTLHVKRLLEQIGVAVGYAEPVLLVGETGTGKTTAVQQLADCLGCKLFVVNLSQQSEAGDLLGGYKPVNLRTLAMPLKDEFDELFSTTGLSATKNQKYLGQLGKYVAKEQWLKATKLWREAPKMFNQCLLALKKESEQPSLATVPENPPKRRKVTSRLQTLLDLKPRWDRFSERLDQFILQLVSGNSKSFAFKFIEGNIVKAARDGDWVLLDEINLASSDTLESISDLLNSHTGKKSSILLSETGDLERVYAHPGFRIFGAMNPATDVGKRDLPPGIRSRFTEIYVDSPDRNLEDLICVIKAYLKGSLMNDAKAAQDLARLYLNTKRLTDEKKLVDSANQVPHYSFRTLTRVLSYVVDVGPLYGLRRALFEGFSMGFLTLLDHDSEKLLSPLIDHHLLGDHINAKSLLSQTPKYPGDGRQYVPFVNVKKDRHYLLLKGSETCEEQQHYIRTPSVDRNLLNLARATSTRRYPILIQGPTSSGKTSMIEYLAKRTGNKCVRINNHEHTDLQEYLGSYVSGVDGQLNFEEGLLVQALRQGHWIILDELNLAPTDVLEALNRLLDDNRELLIPETQQIVRPNENFMLFATQNPPGLYGGRKFLSRAFRNRFLELHFGEIPEDELQTILQTRCKNVAPSDCGRIVKVYEELSKLRQSNRLFERKESFATLRDLFRWAFRAHDTRDQLAINGYMLLAERVRKQEERNAVRTIIEKVMRVKIDPTELYHISSPEIQFYNATPNSYGIVWTQAMRRLYLLVAHAIRNNEPVLLVGETGCGKTTVCQMLADAFSKELRIVNAHQNTETGDLIGAQRPIRDRNGIMENLKQDLLAALNDAGETGCKNYSVNALLELYRSLPDACTKNLSSELKKRIQSNESKSNALFEWSNGSLVQAMEDGQFFLLDEISLADDAVLERLNPVLETERTILLAEKGVGNSLIRAVDGFQIFATMNPGGDYGKRELSPALRNRFTEIWVPSISDHSDVLHIVEAKLKQQFKVFSNPIIQFAEWFGQKYRTSSVTSITIRDILSWINFMNECVTLDPYSSVVQGASMVYIDTLGANPAALLAINTQDIKREREICLQHLGLLLNYNITPLYSKSINITNEDNSLTIGDFSIKKNTGSNSDLGYVLEAPTTKLNAMRVLRALQVPKPILIEGSPGVGKTTLVIALARACNQPLTRINLSEQTDLMDLFGSDVPVEGAVAGTFAWRDAPFLQAMQKGDWVLLDEMNLASQSVLEGLNACLDHRGEVYISELDQTFKCHPNFFVFAAQNSHHQGGGRKGLPSSFVNRFSVVYADLLGVDDLQLICKQSFPEVATEVIDTIIAFVSRLANEVAQKRTFGSQGGPWEFNLRDALRWLQLLTSKQHFFVASKPSDFLNIIFRQRFRTTKDRLEVERIFFETFFTPIPPRHFFHNITNSTYQVGLACLSRGPLAQKTKFTGLDFVNRLPELESIMICIQKNIPCILVGSSGTGKTSILQHIAAITGNELVSFSLNSDVDTMDLVGGFEQLDPQRTASTFLDEIESDFNQILLSLLPALLPEEAIIFLDKLKNSQQHSPQLFHELAKQLNSLEAKFTHLNLRYRAQCCQRLSETSLKINSARFQWIDGVLIKSLEQGKWLILDNANLCSSSVLDRLNSLLEPNGTLIINEHCGPNGEPKIVKPHPNFRIFLTVDPRFGELSRAMRNRAVEIYFEPLSDSDSLSSPAIQPEASMQRFRTFSQSLKQSDSKNFCLLSSAALDNLSWSDMSLLPRFIASLDHRESNELGPQCEAYISIINDKENENLRTSIIESFSVFSNQAPLDAQIFHPLQNSPIVPVIVKSQRSERIYWLGSILEFILEISSGTEAIQRQRTNLHSLKPNKMNRFQRSLVKERLSTVVKDSTANTADFLDVTLKSLKCCLQNQLLITDRWAGLKSTIFTLLRYWWETYHLVTAPLFEEASFQAHLSIGKDLLSNTNCDNYSVIQIFKDALERFFTSEFHITTGLSMETMWKKLCPYAIPNFKIFDNLVKMEGLAVRFDALSLTASSSITYKADVMNSLVRAYKYIATTQADGTALIASLTKEIEILESYIDKDGHAQVSYFQNQFEAIRQYQILENIHSDSCEGTIDFETMVLSGHSTASLMKFSAATNSSRFLQMIDLFWGTSYELHPVSSTLLPSLLRSMKCIGDIKLKRLRLLEFELPSIGQKLALSSGLINREKLVDLNKILLQLIRDVVATHGEKAARYWEALCLKETIPKSLNKSSVEPHLVQVFQDHFIKCYQLAKVAETQISTKFQSSALAWIHFAVGCIILFVPNKAFDPDKRQRLELQRHTSTKNKLMQKISVLQEFEQFFSRQNYNLRIQLLENDLINLGEFPQILQDIYRPEESKIDQLQGEFNNLLKIVLESNIIGNITEIFKKQKDADLQVLTLFQTNIDHIIRRISDGFEAYSDLVQPVKSILRCLQIGLSLAKIDRSCTFEQNEYCLGLAKSTPFMGATESLPSEELIETHPMEYLTLASAKLIIDPQSLSRKDFRKPLLKAIQRCYNHWKEQLESDRLDLNSKSSLYRYRGNSDDENEFEKEQFNELFPSSEEEKAQSVEKLSTLQIRETAVKLAGIHAEIFTGSTRSVDSLKYLIRDISIYVSQALETESTVVDQEIASILLPGCFYLLENKIKDLNSDVSSAFYNFYTDPNLPECRKLVILAHKIQDRFRELQAIDEIGHMQHLEDVLVSCNELLEFHHTAPLAKIITKLEKVHSYIHEWQFGGWASKINSALTLYESVTSTVVNWRRLELSTWSKLFDMEVAKCQDDAKSWWFVAYEVIVAAPLQISDPDEMINYGQKLLRDLEAYFSSAIIGQYSQRLQLLKQLQKHLEVLQLEVPIMSVVTNAVANFVALYSRYEKPVLEFLWKSRQGLDKLMHDVILMASWKDINIIALRESAKRSHHKLFKIVRKFRALLGQPMEQILKLGIPDADSEKETATPIEIVNPNITVDVSALALCSALIPNWSKKSNRLLNISKTVSLIETAAQIPTAALDSSSYLESFIDNFLTSTSELKKATPSTLTEKNKVTVQHLKSRKRKLFADTLRELRLMGIKYNLSSDVLSKQESLSAVLTRLEHPENIIFNGSQYYFHKFIDIMPRARESTKQHSQDLSSAEIARSSGFLEGLLQITHSQHNALLKVAAALKKFELNLQMAQDLWAPGRFIKIERRGSNHHEILQRLPIIIEVAVDLVKIHSKFGKTSSSPQAELEKWINKFVDLNASWECLSILPPQITSTEHINIKREIDEAVQKLQLELKDLRELYPNLGFIFSQILLWTRIVYTTNDNKPIAASISELDSKLSRLCDCVLVAVENYKKSVKDIPTSSDDLGWFTKSDLSAQNCLSVLRIEIISDQLQDCLTLLAELNFENDDSSRVASACFAVALPFLQKYRSVFQRDLQRYSVTHRAICKTSYFLAKTFIHLATQGFCTPEMSDGEDGNTEKLEGGTGLGDGEGSEDISKDIRDDEDLDELGQEPNTNEKSEISDEEDAVDMADREMEGQLGDVEEKDEDGKDGKDSGDEESRNELDEEKGDVDDLDPTAVDEKMWDGDKDDTKKDQQDDKSQGKKSEDEQVAAEGSKEDGTEENNGGDEGNQSEEEMAADEQGEEVKQEDAENHDAHVDEGGVLDLPDDIELDGEDQKSNSGDEEGMEDLSDAEDPKQEAEISNDKEENAEGESADQQNEQELDIDMDAINIEEEQEGQKIEETVEKSEEEFEKNQDEEGLLQNRDDDANADSNETAPNDAQGAGEDQDSNTDDNNNKQSSAQRDENGQEGKSSEDNTATTESENQGFRPDSDVSQDASDESQDNAAAQPFKKLGDALQEWHRQQSNIHDPSEQHKEQEGHTDLDKDCSNFQHLPDEEAAADTQAQGAAADDQGQEFENSMAIDEETRDMPFQFPDEEERIDDVDEMDVDEPLASEDREQTKMFEGLAGAIIKEAKHKDIDDEYSQIQSEEIEEVVEEADHQLDITHLKTEVSLRSFDDARQQWVHYEDLTRDSSFYLTEQLRLILAPTLATKMRGDFRTGKRLNIKRIIPYIASQYKRDKIWMRRSVPSKRNYQILLAVDDSMSMGESGSGSMAFETLVMISKSLSMLEAGQICVVGFGEDIKVAHDFDSPFSSQAGPKTLQYFDFQQSRTDVARLVKESIELFRSARAKAADRSADLWQLELIISDGICESRDHEKIRRHLREAFEERIMMVFVIMDDVKNKKNGQSVMDLNQAIFVDGTVTTSRYLDSFPFQHYIVVNNVKELPGVLATLLRQWFQEIVDSSN